MADARSATTRLSIAGPRAADDESRSHAERRERFAHRPVVAADHRGGRDSDADGDGVLSR